MGASSSSEQYAAPGSIPAVTRKVEPRPLPPPIDLTTPSPGPTRFFACVPSPGLGDPVIPSDVDDVDTGKPLRFRVVGRLGKGAFGEVFKVRREIQLNNGRWQLLDDALYALKVFPRDEGVENDGLRSFDRELDAMRILFDDIDTTSIVAPVVQSGNLMYSADDGTTQLRPYILFDLINPTTTLGGIVPILQTQDFGPVKNGIIRRVAQALQRLHTPNEDRPGLAHRDLNGGNILIVNAPGGDGVKLEKAWQDKFLETNADGNFIYPGAEVIREALPDFLTRALPPDGCAEPEAPVLLERYLVLRSIIFNATRGQAEELGRTFIEFESEIDAIDKSFEQFEREFVPFEIRLIDFGKALELDDDDEPRPPLKTADPVWWSPGPNSVTGPRVDVWQLSTLAFLMSFGLVPLQPGVPESVYQLVERRSEKLLSDGPEAAIQRALLEEFVTDRGIDLEISDMITWPGRKIGRATIDYYTMLYVFGANFTGRFVLPEPFVWMSGEILVDGLPVNDMRGVASIDPGQRPTLEEVLEEATRAEAGLL